MSRPFFCLFTRFFSVYPILTFFWCWACISIIIPWLLVKQKISDFVKEIDMVLPNHTRAALKYLGGRIWPAGHRFPTTAIDHNCLFYKLRNYFGITGNALKWLTSYLINRFSEVVIDNVHSLKTFNDFVVPQGSILGPLLFFIYK